MTAMMTRAHERPHGRGSAAPVLALLLSSAVAGHAACVSPFSRSTLPERLGNAEFWQLSTGMSEPSGTFAHSDNLVSNEIHFVHMARMLGPGRGVYVGVGPEQNFSYIARLRPPMAFVVDIREENRSLHLMYKALFEVSADRVDFLFRLFSRERPAGIAPGVPVADLFARLEAATSRHRLYEATARTIRDHLLGRRSLPLSARDLEWVDHALRAFYSDGPGIHYGRELTTDSPRPSYRALMTAVDVTGAYRSYLANEADFAFVKDLHQRNLIVPVVGDFAGTQALRRVGDYVREHRAVVRAFYGSNVEVYLNRQGIAAFCNNLASLPWSSQSWFISSTRMQPMTSKLQACPGRPQ